MNISLNKFPIEEFLVSWYVGALIAASGSLWASLMKESRHSSFHGTTDMRRGFVIVPLLVVISCAWAVLAAAIGYGVYTLLPRGLLATTVMVVVILSLLSFGLLKFAAASRKMFANMFPVGTKEDMGLNDVVGVGLLGLGTIICLGIGYWAFSLAPIVVVAPVLLVSEAIIPTLIGLARGEKSQFSKKEWGYAALALIGVCCLAKGY